MKIYFKIWYRMTINSFQQIISTRFGMVIFLFGKLFRFFLYLSFVYYLFSGTNSILGYSRYQTLFFLITFYFLGTVGQMFFREVYRFRGRVASGDFDLDLLKPIHPLLRNMAGGFDLLDLLTLPIYLIVIINIMSNLNFSTLNFVLFLALSLNGLIVMMAIHVLIAALAVLTTEIDSAVMVYRDLEAMGRFPVDIYKEPLKQILTFVIPIGLIFTIPAKALLGLISWSVILPSFVVGLISLYLSIKFWNFAISKYTSASS